MAQANIEILLQNGVEAFGSTRYNPAANLKGAVTVYPDSEVKCDHLYVRLEWHTEGRGSRYQETVEELDLFQGTLPGGFPRVFEFEFQLPEEPWSYEGFYVSVVWAITVQLDVPWKKDPQHELSFLLAPEREPGTDSW